MKLILRRIAVENFRKFRERYVIEGLTEGLNIVVEPNETGKSTIMEAARAALFLRHGSKTQLIQSFLPYGDSVAPEVEVEFDLGGDAYKLTKRFLSKPSIELAGPSGRSQGEAAEEALQELLGFEAQGRAFDTDALGTLGLLWVPQAEGLSLVTPGEHIRSGISGSLESEAGVIMGSAAFDHVWDRIEGQHGRYRTATGRPTAELKAAEARVERATEALADTRIREAALEQAYTDFDNTGSRLRIVTEDLTDEAEAANREVFTANLATAKSAAQILETKSARHAQAEMRFGQLESLSDRHAAAIKSETERDADLKSARSDREILKDKLAKAKLEASERKAALAKARGRRTSAREALAIGQKQSARLRRTSAIATVRTRHEGLLKIEARRTGLAKTLARAVPPETLQQVEQAETDIAKYQAALDAGGVKVEYRGTADLTLDGEKLASGEVTLTRESTIGLQDGGALHIRPPLTLAGAEAGLEDARSRRNTLLEEWDAQSLSDLRSVDSEARQAKVEHDQLAAQIETLTPADLALDLAAGSAALKLFVANLVVDGEPDHQPGHTNAATTLPPLDQLQGDYDVAEIAISKAEEFNSSAIDELRRAEKDEAEVGQLESRADGDLKRVREDIEELTKSSDFENLDDKLAKERAELAKRGVALGNAKRDAETFDAAQIQRQIDKIDQARQAATNCKSDLERDLAALEARIEIEGGKGLAEQGAAAAEEVTAAETALARMVQEADTLGLLRDVLTEAREEVSRTLVGPVARRASSYIQRILPGSDPIFDTGLALPSIRRGGVEEETERLSSGTQEQLALLTRLAFADMLREQGKPVSLILDDPLVYSDDVRLDAMIDLLAEASAEMQIIVLTCRDRAFRAAPGTRITF